MRRAACCLALLVLAAAAAVAADTPPAGDLLVTCWPGFRVVLDGAPAGVTVSEEDGRYLTGLAAGEHVVRIEKDGFVPREYTVAVPAGGLVELKVGDLEPAAGAIKVLAGPGWRVYLDDRLVGLTSAADGGLLVPEVALGPHTVRVEKLGREPVVLEVEVAGGAVAEVSVDGAAADAPAVPEAAAATVHVEPAAVPEAPAAAATTPPRVLDTATAELPSEPPATPPAAPTGSDFDLERQAPKPADVLFAYRARGAGLAAGGTVTMTRERGGPRAPVMVFWCVDQSECRDQTRAAFAPGSYRFRVNCRAGREPSAADADAFVELEAESGHSYLIDAAFDGGCTASAVAVGD